MKCEKAWLSNREWIFVIILVILSQFLLHQYASNVMNEMQVINYISFSGTIVSIILAILAIVYSFFQSITQQSNSDKIASNLESLTGVASSVNTSVDIMTTQVETLNTVVDDVRKLPSDIVSLVSVALAKLNKEHVVDIRAAFSEYIEVVKSNKEIDSVQTHTQKIKSEVVLDPSKSNIRKSHNSRWTILTTTIVACILVNRLRIYKLHVDILKGAKGNKEIIDELTILYTGALSAIRVLKALDIIHEEEEDEEDEDSDSYCYVPSELSDSDISYKLFSVVSIYHRDAYDDINKKLGPLMGKVLIDALGLTPESTKISKHDIVSRIISDL
ncbi:hypothetical protein ACEU5N_19750 [Aeromonas salmonicida]|uniref:hypothetical protein n=1 Tax=Aeromonas salmonicida TaxID=645 RepID=UPI0035A5AAC6